MAWQDWVFSVGGLLILISLIPTIRAEEKPALTTSLMTTVLVTVFATTMITLGLWLAAVTNYGIAAAWAVLAVQGYRLKQKTRHEGVIEQVEEEILHSLPHIHTEETTPGASKPLIVATKAEVRP